VELDHADILFREIIGEGDVAVMKKRQHGGFIIAKPGEEILGLGLFGSASCLCPGWCREGVGFPAKGENIPVLFQPGVFLWSS